MISNVLATMSCQLDAAAVGCDLVTILDSSVCTGRVGRWFEPMQNTKLFWNLQVYETIHYWLDCSSSTVCFMSSQTEIKPVVAHYYYKYYYYIVSNCTYVYYNI